MEYSCVCTQRCNRWNKSSIGLGDTMGGKWTFSRIFEVVFQSLASVFEIGSAGDAVADRQQAAAAAWLPRAMAGLAPLPAVNRMEAASVCFSSRPHSLSPRARLKHRERSRRCRHYSAEPCTSPSFFHLRAPGSPASSVTGSAVLSLASRDHPRPSFVAVARGHRCRGCRGHLCARPG